MKLPKIETLLVLTFLGCIALWAVSKCSTRRSDIAQRVKEMADEREERPYRRDTVFIPQSGVTAPPGDVPPMQPSQAAPSNTPAPKPQTFSTSAPAKTPAASTAPAKTPVTTTSPTKTTTAPAKTTTAKPANTTKSTTLYVTIDGLKMRKTPGLKGELITKLELYEPVTFLNQKSPKTEEISLGYEKVTDYWVKVKTQSGKEGWVFGAGVHYYKMKRKGVIE